MTEKLLVIGATGQVGQRVVREALLSDSPKFLIRILVRSIPRAKETFQKDLSSQDVERIEFVEGDLSSEGTVEGALEGGFHKNVICAAGAGKVRFWLLDYFTKIPVSHAKYVDYEGVCTLARLLSSYSLPPPKLVLVSSLCVSRPWNIVSIILNSLVSFVLEYKLKSEIFVRSLNLNYVIIRPGGLIEDDSGNKKKAEGSMIYVDQGDTLVGLRISTADVAKMCLVSLTSPAISRASFDTVWKKKEGSSSLETKAELEEYLASRVKTDSDTLEYKSHAPPLFVVYGVLSVFVASSVIALSYYFF